MIRQIIQAQDQGWWVVSQQQKLWLVRGELPAGTAGELGLSGLVGARIGRYQQQAVWLVFTDEATDEATDKATDETGGTARPMSSLRQLLDDPVLFQLAGRGVQLAAFCRSHQFCGYCGHRMQAGEREWVMLCSHCPQRYYPQIAPCIIVAVRRDECILLAQHQRHRNGIYTVLAGFVEAGETLEQALAREVMEECQLQVKNVRYVASQPWPFPHSLMMAYTADYAGGQLCIDERELLDAGWYRYDQLPSQLPPAGTVARRLIEDTLALCRNESPLT